MQYFVFFFKMQNIKERKIREENENNGIREY